MQLAAAHAARLRRRDLVVRGLTSRRLDDDADFDGRLGLEDFCTFMLWKYHGMDPEAISGAFNASAEAEAAAGRGGLAGGLTFGLPEAGRLEEQLRRPQ